MENKKCSNPPIRLNNRPFKPTPEIPSRVSSHFSMPFSQGVHPPTSRPRVDQRSNPTAETKPGWWLVTMVRCGCRIYNNISIYIYSITYNSYMAEKYKRKPI